MKELYESPKLELWNISPEGILCSSGTEENELLEGEW